jgi:glycosyltransferase involved in cell wall biosynthesis
MPKDKILLFLKLPPPQTGATLMNKYVAESPAINQRFTTHLISISYKSKIEDVAIISFRKIATILRLYYLLLKELLQFKPDLIYFQISPLGWAFYRDCSYVFLMKIFRKKIVYHMHGKGISEAVNRSKITKNIYRWVFRNSSMICLSESLVYDIEAVYSGKPFIVNNGIPAISKPERVGREGKNTFSILFLSNLILSKGILVFLDAIEVFKSKHTNFIATIVGKEAEISSIELQAEIEKRDLKNEVFYLGPKYGDEKNQVFMNSDVLVYPTYNDVWGLVIIEAMQFGLPVIATREGAIPLLVEDGVTGLLAEKKNPEQLSDKLYYLYCNREIGKQMGLEGQKIFYNRYTLEKFEENVVKVFDKVLTGI